MAKYVLENPTGKCYFLDTALYSVLAIEDVDELALVPCCRLHLAQVGQKNVQIMLIEGLSAKDVANKINWLNA